jgi:hypothetical protein
MMTLRKAPVFQREYRESKIVNRQFFMICSPETAPQRSLAQLFLNADDLS